MADWSQAIYLEHRVAEIISRQERNGWLFDVELAHQHIATLDKIIGELYEKITDGFGPVRDTKKRTCARPFTTTGELSAKVEKLLGGERLPIAGPFTYTKGKLSEKGWVVENLLSRGWAPVQFTEKTGQPMLTFEGDPVPTLLAMEDSIGHLLSDWMTYEKRRGTILNRDDKKKGWLNNVREDNRIPAYANSCGTNTGRMRHRLVVNVPKADEGVLFGSEMRELFTVPKGKVLIGHDASGLEARVMGHYLGDQDLIYELIHGDFHTKVWDTIRDFVDNRNVVKSIEYAMIYGAYDKKLGSLATQRPNGWSNTKTGKTIRERIMVGIPALGELTKRVKAAGKKRGYLIGLDGRKIYHRAEFSILNTLFQSAGAILMKKSMVLLDDWIKEEGWGSEEYMKLIDQHDESQAEVVDNENIIELYSSFAVQSIRDSGTHFKLRCPLDAEAKVGRNWAETH